MLHNIEPYKYFCDYRPRQADNSRDYMLLFGKEQILLKEDKGSLVLPRPDNRPGLRYLFSIDNTAFFDDAALEQDNTGQDQADEGWQPMPLRGLRKFQPSWQAFAAITGHHLHFWYTHNRYCGACGTTFSHKSDERALICPSCGYLKYPDIAIAVIVGVYNGEKLLLTKYTHHPYSNLALIAGFVEIGESLEDTIRREVYEEVGLHVKNIHYFASQPWGFSHSLLAGFFAQVDGDIGITLDHKELAEAVWMQRQDIEADSSLISLTSTMMTAFKEGKAGCCGDKF